LMVMLISWAPAGAAPSINSEVRAKPNNSRNMFWLSNFAAQKH
jgi:hypothetical protein